MQNEYNMPPTDDADFLAVLNICDPVATDQDGWETLMSWAPGPAVTSWLAGFRAAREALAG